MAKIKVKVTKLAYYKDALVYPGEIIEYEGKLPSWATLADGENQTKKTTDEKQIEKEKEKEVKKEPKENKEKQELPQEKSEVELQEELDALLNESVDKGIILDNFEKMTIVEQIAELKVLLGK